MFKQLLGFLLGILVLAPFGNIAQAKVFRNAYLTFELPDTWKCVLEHTEWVCRSENEKDSKEAIIILTAKEVGVTDSFDKYTEHLSKPLTNGPKTGVNPSKIIYPPKQTVINEQPWIDGMHLASEVPNYFTRYLATIKDKIAVLVTFSAHKDRYTKYSQDFFRAVQSLRVVAAKNLLAQPEGPIRPGSDMLGFGAGLGVPNDMYQNELNGGAPAPRKGMSKSKMMLAGIGAVLALLVLIVLSKMRK